MVDTATLREAMGRDLPTGKYPTLVADYNAALLAADCTTVNRAAMFAAQIGHESGGLRYMEEIASGADYEGRRDLGNTQSGDGRRFKGRGPIQLTGRHNYGKFSAWCHGRGLVDTPDYFVRNPTLVATSRWGFLAASWYWTVARPKINSYCDKGDALSVSREINGWIKLRDGSWRTPNGWTDRSARWERCRRLGNRLLSDGTAPAPARPPGTPAPNPDLMPRLTEGMTSDLIWKLQVFMNDNFSLYSKIDAGDRPPSRLGPQTVRVIEEFQGRSDIPNDPPFAIARNTWAALFAAGFRP
jgi:predicted chitinase